MNPYFKRIKNQLLLAIACTAVLGGCDIAGEDVIPASIADFRLVPDEVWGYVLPQPANLHLTMDPLLNDSVKVNVNVTFTQPQHGRFVVNDTITYYRPFEGFLGADKFTYTVCSDEKCKTEEVLVYVEEMPDLNTCVPEVNDDEVHTVKNQWVDIRVFKNDRICSVKDGVGILPNYEGSGAYEIIWGDNPHPNNVIIRYYPPKDFVGQDQITYGYCVGDCSVLLEAIITININ